MNIVLFGDSHLGRFGQTLTERLEGLVEGSIVYNCSAGGFTSNDGVKRATYIAQLNPDVVIFSYGGNDVAPWKVIVPKDIYLENMRKIFEAFPNSKKILFTSPAVKVVDPIQTQQYNAAIHEYRDVLGAICTELHVSIIDGGHAVAPLGDNCHESDGVHMNEAAYSKVIEAFANTIHSF